ncbi:MAG TPA: RHS repeat-associated core domain-containing protein [Candidatus Acidoferrales bacterium]|nr:RHS repeat-associated core domain-containing protein [Candidatus Acidoferrales bacterium]
MLSKTDRNDHTINYTYDYLNRLSQKAYPDSTAVNYTYDLANRLTQVTDPTGSYGFTYDNMNRLTQTSAAYSFISGKTFTVGYGYDAASNRTSMTDPQNAATAYVYDTLNRLTTLTYPSHTNFTFSYDALGRRTKLVRPNGVTTNYQYDTISHLLSALHQITSKSGTTTLDGATYQDDVAGNRTSRTDNRTNVTSNFSYDPIYQLTQVTQGSTTAESYSYDPVGNRLSSLGVSPYAYNGSNELTSKPGATYTYDNNGIMLTKTDSTGTTTYTWDFENRLTSVALPGSGGTVTFKYDPFGGRAQKSSLLGTTNYLYDGADSLEEVDTTGNVLARYTRGPGIDQPLAEVRSGTSSYYEADGLGSVTSLSNSSGALANTYTYDSFGNLTASTGTLTNPLRYTAREFDSETGTYFYRARYYDPTTGRFLTEDPIGLGGGINRYPYVRANPISRNDSGGLCDDAKCDVALKAANKDRGAVDRANAVWDTIEGAADANDIDPALLAAIGVLETGFQNVNEKDGAGVGVGVFQITVSLSSGVTSAEARNLTWAANYAANMLNSNANYLAGKFPSFTPTQLLQATAASYNLGPGGISGNPNTIDKGSKPHNNYGSLVLQLMNCF